MAKECWREKDNECGVDEYLPLLTRERSSRIFAQNNLSSDGASFIIGTYCVSSSTVFMPYIFGRLGLIGGTVSLAFHFVVCFHLQQLMVDITVETKSARTLPTLAQAVGGPSIGLLFTAVQYAVQLLNLPLLLRFMITSTKSLFLSPLGAHDEHMWGCDITWLVAVTLPMICLVNARRRLGHAEWMCLATCAINVLQVLLINADTMKSMPVGQPRSTVHLFPEWPLNNDERSRGHWVGLFTSLSMFNYCYNPAFICIEVMQEMKNPSDMKSSLRTSAVAMYLIYIIGGITPVIAWGWKRDPNILVELHHGIVSACANIFLILPSAVDFVICAISLNQIALQNYLPHLDADDWTRLTREKWFLLSLVPVLIALLLLCLVHRLTALAGLLNCLAVPCAQILGPAVLAIRASQKGMFNRELKLHERVTIFLGINLGLLMIFCGMTSTAYELYWGAAEAHGFPCDLGL